MFSKIVLNTDVSKEDTLVTKTGEKIKITQLTHKKLYEEALLHTVGDHHSQVKWVIKLNTSITWEDVWNTVHNILSTNQTKSIIWQQLHLNFYTQYSYNKWHQKQDMCPLCKKMPENIFHIILHCDFTNKLWEGIEPLLKDLYPVPVSEEEKAFGIVQKKSTTGILLRNWLTYLLRDCIMQEEKEAYHSSKPNLGKIKKRFNQTMEFEILMKIIRYENENNLAFFDEIITHKKEVLCKKRENEKYQITEVYT